MKHLLHLHQYQLRCFGTSGHPLSSQFQICLGESIFKCLRRASYWSKNVFMTAGLAHIALFTDKLCAFLILISGWCFKKKCIHFFPAFQALFEKPLMLLTSVYWNASAWTLDLLKGKPALLNSKINLTNSSSLSAGVRTKI